jgi:hypothetical protein
MFLKLLTVFMAKIIFTKMSGARNILSAPLCLIFTATLFGENMHACVFISKSRATLRGCVNALRDFPHFVTFSTSPPQLPLPLPFQMFTKINLEVIQLHRNMTGSCEWQKGGGIWENLKSCIVPTTDKCYIYSLFSVPPLDTQT